MSARVRHARPHGQPRRAWSPLGADVPRTLPVLAPVAAVLDAKQTQAVRDQFANDLWVATRTVYGVSGALVVLAPKFGRRLVRGLGRRIWSTLCTTIYAVSALGIVVSILSPVAYEVGV